MTHQTKLVILIVNTVLCAIAIPISFGVQLMSVMGGASATGHETLGCMIVSLGMGCIAMPPVSIAGSWLTMRWTRVSMLFVAAPWIYAALLFGCIGLLFATA